MNDKFLTQFQKEPNPLLKASLWHRLQQIQPVTPDSPQSIWTKRPFQFALAITLIGFLTAAGFMPQVQAQIEDVIRRIGGVTIKETQTTPNIGEDVIIVPNTVVTGPLDEMVLDSQERLGFEYEFPTSIPSRYEFRKVTYGHVGRTSASFLWIENQSRTGLILDIRRANSEINWLVGPDSTEEVTVNGQPAALTTGAWNADTNRWDQSFGTISLRWEQDGVEYNLSGMVNAITSNSLIDIAESVPRQ
ncbi:MAG: hypothetical protein AAF490_27160 [Chloroflexota bacterium]